MLLVLHQHRNVLTEQRKRRIRNHDVGLVKQCQALCRTEIAITFQLRQLVFVLLEKLRHVEHIDTAVTGRVVHLRDNRLVRLVFNRLVTVNNIEQR